MMTMKNTWRKHIALLAAVAFMAAAPSASLAAVQPEEAAGDKVTNVVVRNRVEALGTDSIDDKILTQLVPNVDVSGEKVVVGKDTVDIIIPQRNFGRFDRGLFNYLFIPKGQWSFGLDVSYGEFNSDDIELLSFIGDFDFGGSMFSIDPYISYFFAHNQSIGMRLGYTRNKADLGNLTVDIEDLDLSLQNIDYHTEEYSASVFYRHYIGLDRSRRWAIFNETALEFSSGNGYFERPYEGVPRITETVTTEVRMDFSPGICYFVHDYVSFNLSFGVFGLHWKRWQQTTDHVEEGSRTSSGADFKFNLFNLRMGIAVHI